MAVFGRGERVVHRVVTLCLFVVFEHGEVHHPHRRPAVFKQTVLLAKLAVADFQTQCADGVIHNLGLVCTKENQVAVLCAAAFEHFVQGFVVDVFNNRRLQTITAFGQRVHADVSQAFGTINFHELGVGINFTPADAALFVRAVRHAQGHHASTFHVGGTRENFEIHIGHDVCELGQFELDAQIGFVRAETVHGFAVSHDGELAQVHIQSGFEHAFDHVLEHGANFFFAQE